MKIKSQLRKGDLCVIAGILFLAVGIFLIILLPSSEKKNCVVLQDNAIIREIDLSAQRSETITVSGEYENIIEIKGGKVRILSSTCPNHTCVSSGWISKSGQSIVCVPNHLLIKIVSHQEPEVDVIVS